MSDSKEKANDTIENEDYDTSTTPFSWDKLEGLLYYKATLVTCSEFLGKHENVIKYHIRKRYGLNFTDYADRKLSRTKVKLVQKALDMAYEGNTAMMIFCLKNICKWADNQDNIIDINGAKVQINIDKHDDKL